MLRKYFELNNKQFMAVLHMILGSFSTEHICNKQFPTCF